VLFSPDTVLSSFKNVILFPLLILFTATSGVRCSEYTQAGYPPNHFIIREAMRILLFHVDVEIVGLAESGTYIEKFVDVKTGVYLSARGAPTITMKVTEPLIENDPSKIISILPDLPAGKICGLEVHTQYTHGGSLLKDVRTIKAGFMLTTYATSLAHSNALEFARSTCSGLFGFAVKNCVKRRRTDKSFRQGYGSGFRRAGIQYTELARIRRIKKVMRH
jgi:hypothetical protein